MYVSNDKKPRRMLCLILMAVLYFHVAMAMKNSWNEARNSWDGRQQYWRNAGGDSRGRGGYTWQERRTSGIAEATAAAAAAATSAANDKNKKKKQKKSKRSKQKKHRKGGKSSSSDESDTESSTSETEESTDGSSGTTSSEDDKKEKRKSKKGDRNKKGSKEKSKKKKKKKKKKEEQEKRKKRSARKKAAGTPTRECNDEEKRDLRAKLEAEQLRARMWQELCEANNMAETKPSTPCRRGTRTPLGGQTAKRQEEEEGRGVNVAEALR